MRTLTCSASKTHMPATAVGESAMASSGTEDISTIQAQLSSRCTGSMRR